MEDGVSFGRRQVNRAIKKQLLAIARDELTGVQAGFPYFDRIMTALRESETFID
jgi:hypothetical protein